MSLTDKLYQRKYSGFYTMPLLKMKQRCPDRLQRILRYPDSVVIYAINTLRN